MIRLKKIGDIQTPYYILNKYKKDIKIFEFVKNSRQIISDIINKKDERLLVISGPCSIHSYEEAIDYAKRLKKTIDENPDIFVVMRVYLEKPRTVLGWKGYLNDPFLNNSFDINFGIESARKLLLEINNIGIPVGVEFLDQCSVLYLQDLVSWGAIGARTTQSQEHRKMASGLDMPIGFKNSTSGEISHSIDSIKSISHSHIFLGLDLFGKIAKMQSSGNPDGHIILRGHDKGTNYDKESVFFTTEKLIQNNINTGIIIDFSHGNSMKKYYNQIKVCDDVCNQLEYGNKNIVGVMIEGNINTGNQCISDNLSYGVSITDECVGWDDNQKMLKKLNNASFKRKTLKKNI